LPVTGARPGLLFSLLLLLTAACRPVQPDENQSGGGTAMERSVRAEALGDSLLAEDMASSARDSYVRAALLRRVEDPGRSRLVWKAAEALDSASVITAQLLLESSDSLAPYRALQLGGANVVPDLLSYMSRNSCVMPEYLNLVMADSLFAAEEYESSLLRLAHVPAGLPDRADDKRTVLYCGALLHTGNIPAADSIIESSRGDDELLSLLQHQRGMWMLQSGLPGHREALVESFQLWPAAPVHAAAYDAVRGEILANRDFAASVADPFYSGGLWNELYDIAGNSADPDPHLWYLAARTRDRLGFYGAAADMLEEYLRRWPEEEDAPNALIYLGRDLGRSGRWQEGLDVLEEYGRLYPDHYRIGNLPWYIGDMLAENRQWESAAPWFRMTIEQYPYNVTADDAHFYLCFSLMKTGAVSSAITELEAFTVKWTGSVYRSSARYWLGRLLMQEGNPRGRALLEDLVEDAPASLPAYFARELLGLPPWEPVFTEEPLESWMTRNGLPPVQPPEESLRGLFLQRAGLRHLADGEFRRAEELVGGPERLAPFYLRNDVWERRPISGYRMWDLSGDDRPRELWMLRYQRAWPELVNSACRRYGLDPLFAWAIVRNESMFQPTCYSVAGARGLIQMIPSTSEYVALENGWDDYSPDRLYDPAVSLEYGINYISGIYGEFDQDPVITAAAYNGGPHNALHWGAGDMETEEFFALITYNETKSYAQNVHHAYMIYRALYE